MKKLLFALLALPVLAADPWTGPHIALEAGYQAALLCDWRQTSDFHKPIATPNATSWVGNTSHVEFHESNTLLGAHPSQATINQMCLISSVGHLAISHFLPSSYRTLWQGASLVLEFDVAFVNSKTGQVRINVKF